MPITNRDRFPDVDFFPANKIQPIGSAEGTTLVIVGKEQGTDAMVVAKSYSADPQTEDLFAVPLYELLNHTQGEVKINDGAQK